MDRRVFKKSLFASIVSVFGPLIFTLGVIAIIWAGVGQAEESSRAEGIRLLEEAILRAAVHSYAIEGQFPQSLSHLAENYNIYIDETRFVVHYEVFASNLLPYIRVFELNR